MINIKIHENKDYWNNIYKGIKTNKITYDLWLDKYKDIFDLNRDSTFLDLGCGSGADTLYLKERGYNVLACDYSEEALNIIKESIMSVDTLQLDIMEKLPFDDESFNIIIADLSLHYFTEKDTLRIMNEIRRITKNDGYFICRVNSIKDYNYGASQGEEIEKNYFKTKYGNKRFFEKDDIDYFFSMWNIESSVESTMNRYGDKKMCFEICCRK